MQKILMLAGSSLLSLGLVGFAPFEETSAQDEPPPPAKKKGEPGPKGELHKAYELLRRIKADDSPSGRSDERLRDWTDRAVKYYRKGIDALATEPPHVAHEYGLAAHDLARTVDHARNASRFDRPDPDLPPPPEGPGPERDGAQARRELRHAYDRITEADADEPEAKFYLGAARDLYNAARRDAEANRNERAGELARAAEAITHVSEHLANATRPAPEPPRDGGPEGKARKKGDRPDPEDGPEPKAKKKRDRDDRDDDPEPKVKKKGDRPDPKAKKGERPDDEELPPPLPVRD